MQGHVAGSVRRESFGVILILVVILIQGMGCGPTPERSATEAISCLKTLAGNAQRPDVRADALLALGKARESSIMTQLRSGLGSREEDLAFKSALALEEVGGPEAIVALREGLGGNGRPFTRAQIVVSLYRLGDPSGIPELRAALGDTADPLRRASACSALGKVGDRSIVQRLIGILGNDPEFMPRSSAATGLGMLGDPTAVPYLVRSLREDREEVVRISSAGALARIGGSVAISALEESFLKETNYVLRRSLLSALEDTRASRGIFPVLRARFAKTGDTVDRSLSAEAMGRFGDREAVPLLRAVLQADTDPVVQLAAGEALARLGEREAMMAIVLRFLIKHDNDSFRIRAGEILVEFGDASVSSTFRRLIAWDGNPELRAISARGLGRLGERTGIASLQKALENDADENVRAAAAAALGAIPYGAAREALAAALVAGNQTQGIRTAVARALGSRKDPGAIGSLVKALRDPDPKTQLEVALAILKLTKGIDLSAAAAKS